MDVADSEVSWQMVFRMCGIRDRISPPVGRNVIVCMITIGKTIPGETANVTCRIIPNTGNAFSSRCQRSIPNALGCMCHNHLQYRLHNSIINMRGMHCQSRHNYHNYSVAKKPSMGKPFH